MRPARLAGALLLVVAAAAPLGRGGTASGAMAGLHTLAVLAAVAALAVRSADRSGTDERVPGSGPRRPDEASAPVPRVAEADRPSRPGGRRLPPAIALMAAFAVWCALGTVRAGYLFASFTASWDVAVTGLVLWTAWRIGTRSARPLLTGVLLTSAGAQATWALGQHVFRDGLRGSGSFLNPNHLGAYLNLAAGLAAGRLVARRGRDPIAAIALAVLLGAQWMAVASRGAVLAAAVVALGAVVMARRELGAMLREGGGRRVAAIVTLGVVLAVGGVGAAGLARRFAGPEDVHRHARMRIWPASLGAAAEVPLVGTGPGMFKHVAERHNFPRSDGPVRYGRRFHTTHSQYLEVLVETGAVGLLLFLAALGAAFAGVAARRRAEGGDDGFRIGALAGLAALAMQGIGEPLLSTPGIALPAAVVAGTALAARGGTSRRARTADVRVRVAAIGVGLGVYYLAVVAPWLGDRHFGRMLRARDGGEFREELSLALRFNPMQPYYYSHATETILSSVPALEPASYAICYDYAAKAARLNPADPRLLILRAEVSRRAFQEVFHDRATLEEALELYAAAVEAAPTDPSSAAALAGFLLDLGRDAGSLRRAEEALSIEPNFILARRMRVEALRRLGRAAEADEAERRLHELLRDLAGYQPENRYEAMILEWRTDVAGRS